MIQIKKLYQDGNSVTEIGRLLKISPRKVEYWMDKNKIRRRSRSEALYIKNNRHGHPFTVPHINDLDSAFSLGLGIGLFWGEGMKLNKNGVRLGNSDPYLIVHFKTFLKNIFGVAEDKFRYSLQIFGDHNSEAVVGFWAKMLGVTKKVIGKPSLVKLTSKGTYKKKSKYGVLQIAVFNTKLKQLFDSLTNYLKENPSAVVAQLVEHIHGEAQSLSPTQLETNE